MIAQNLAAHAEDAKDHNLPLMIWYGIEPLVAADADRALATFTNSPIDQVSHFAVRRAGADPSLRAALWRFMLSSLPNFVNSDWRGAICVAS